MIGCLMKDVGGNGSGKVVGVEAHFEQIFLIATDNGDDAFGGGVGDDVSAEDILGKWGWLFEEVDGVE